MDASTSHDPTPVAPDTDQTPAGQSPEPAAPTRPPLPRGWLIVFVVLAVAFVVSAIIVILVASPPSYEPVPVPSVDRV